jgi:hypothetical protein
MKFILSFAKRSIKIIASYGILDLVKFLAHYLILNIKLRKKLSLISIKHKIENPGISHQKFLNINYWLFENMRRFYKLGLQKKKKELRILDLGTGPGYFPFICTFYGYEVESLDKPDNEMYNDMIKELGIKRYEENICSYKDINIEKKHDLITAFMICFNNHRLSNLWHISEWEYFLNSLFKNNLNTGGEICLLLNAETTEEPINKELLKYFASINAKIKDTTIHIKNT